jgi:hypothetical protein
VSGEWGFGHTGQSINLLPDFVSAMRSHTTPFGGENLDGPGNLDGPQGGLYTVPPLADVGGLGGVQGPVEFTLTLNRDWDIGTHFPGAAIVEFGSDVRFLQLAPIPEPGPALLLACAGLLIFMGRRRCRRSSPDRSR